MMLPEESRPILLQKEAKLMIISTFIRRASLGTLLQRMYGHVHIIAHSIQKQNRQC